MPRLLPNQSDRRFLVYGATGTDLIFNRGIDLPNFASFPLNMMPEAQPVVVQQMRDLVEVAQKAGFGAIIDTLTWMANRDRAAPLGYDQEQLKSINRQAVELMKGLQAEVHAPDVLLGLCVGPAGDAYSGGGSMSVADARAYHGLQIGSVTDMGLDLVNAYTFNLVDEAAGAILAAGDHGLPIAMSLVVETDGCLDDGTPLEAAIDAIDSLTDQGAAYFMVNCAHPDHFETALTGHPRLKGMVVNASRCSHAELDNAEELDAGDPNALAAQVAQLVQRYPAFSVIGGCCGTDMRHLTRMVEEIAT